MAAISITVYTPFGAHWFHSNLFVCR